MAEVNEMQSWKFWFSMICEILDCAIDMINYFRWCHWFVCFYCDVCVVYRWHHQYLWFFFFVMWVFLLARNYCTSLLLCYILFVSSICFLVLIFILVLCVTHLFLYSLILFFQWNPLFWITICILHVMNIGPS